MLEVSGFLRLALVINCSVKYFWISCSSESFLVRSENETSTLTNLNFICGSLSVTQKEF